MYTLSTLCKSRSSISKTNARNMQKIQKKSRHMEEEGDILIFDIVSGRDGTITRRLCYVFEYKNHKQRLLGYQDKSKGKVYTIVNAVTKSWIQVRDLPILIMMNYSNLLDDPYEKNP